MKWYIWYIYVMLTIIFESIGFYFLNNANWVENKKNLIIWLLFFNLTTLSFSMALKTIDLTLANVLWASCSLIVAALIWYFAFWEHYTWLQYFIIFIIILCIIWLNLSWIRK